MAKTVQPCALVSGEGGAPEEFRQFPGRTASRQVHLEETILRVDETKGAGDVESCGALDGRHSKRVAINGDRSRESCNCEGAIELRQAASQLYPGPPCGDQGKKDDQEQQPTDHAQETSHWRILRGA